MLIVFGCAVGLERERVVEKKGALSISEGWVSPPDPTSNTLKVHVT